MEAEVVVVVVVVVAAAAVAVESGREIRNLKTLLVLFWLGKL